MNQSENAALHALQQLEQIPSDRVWLNLTQEWERSALSQSLSNWQETPHPGNWQAIQSGLKQKKRIRFRVAAAAVLVIGLWLVQRYSINPENQAITTASPLAATHIVRTPPPPFPPIRSNTATTNQAINIKPKPFSPERTRDNGTSNFLLVAAKNGDPIRIPNRWSNLACCISGETQTADCHQQQAGWHQELEASNLGFHADPFLGLIELVEAAEKPANFSPTL